MSLKASCFAVKQQFYGHFLATRIFHLATEKKISVATWRSHKKVNFGPWSAYLFLNNTECCALSTLGRGKPDNSHSCLSCDEH